MSKASPWFGYLEIGEKSSPVVRDPKLNTGKADTIYLFNLKRNEIIEYKSEIVEPKLREFNKDEANISKELRKAFNKAIKEFTPRGKSHIIPDSLPGKEAPAKKPKEEELVDIVSGDDDDAFDDDLDSKD